MTTQDCLTDDELRAFILGELPERIAQTVNAHLEQCANCEASAQRLDGLADPLTRRLRCALGPESTPAPAGGARELVMETPEVLAAAPVAPPRLAGYTILEELGRGGMSVVYKARQERPDRLVALKMILAGRYTTADRRARFLFEAEAIARLQHPNVVQIYEVGRHDDLPYLVLEFVDGQSLDRRLKVAPMAPTEAAALVETLAWAVHHAHERGVIHRDLKPSNVLLAADGTPKVTDFGLAKQERPNLTATGDLLGTPSYMAPEQAAGDNSAVGPATDVYALGAILYEALTGRPPFRAATAMETLRQVLHEEAPAPRVLRPDLPRDLETICLSCLQKEPGRRYADARALAEDLRRFQAREPIAARRASGLERLGLWTRRRPTLAAVYGLTALTALLVAGGGTASWLWRDAEQARKQLSEQQTLTKQLLKEEQEARQEADQAREGEKKAKDDLARVLNFQRVSLAHADWGQNDPSRSRYLLRACPAELRQWEWNYVYRECHPELCVRSGLTSWDLAVACRSDGARLAGVFANGTLRLWDGNTEQQVVLLARPLSLGVAAFRSDGQRVAGACSDGMVRVWDAQTGRRLLELKIPELSRCMAFSADGGQLAVATYGKVYRWDAGSGESLPTLLGEPALHLQPGLIPQLSALAFSPDGKRLAAACRDNTVRVWDLASGRQQFNLKGHAVAVCSVAYSPDGARLASASIDGALRFWDAQTGEEKLVSKADSQPVVILVYSPDSKRLAGRCEDHTVRLWDAQTGQEQLVLKGNVQDVTYLAFTADGKRVVSGARDGVVRVWDIQTPRGPCLSITNPAHVASVNCSPDSTRMALTWGDGVLHIYDGATCQELFDLKGDRWSGPVYSPDGQQMAVASINKIHLLEAKTGREKAVLEGHGNMISSVAYRSDGRRLAVAHMDRTLSIWDTQALQEVRFFETGPVGALFKLAFSPDGAYLAGAPGSLTAFVWDAQTGHEAVVLRAESGIRSVAYSPDGERLAGACSDGTVRVWNAHTGQEILIVQGHTGIVNTVAYSPDGRRLASGSNDRTVRLWDAETGREALVLKGHTNMVMGVQFTPDGHRLVSVGLDGTVRVWDGSPPADVPD